ncbi:unnamed protein product, partial [Mesorhabditis belari]|uniref:Uncharacterized protein n=1 Tax=Mesorhabditis belari TaxID=2138241 RepID=A0AAF3J2I3_9BILA
MILADLAQRLQLDVSPNTYLIELLVVIQVHILAVYYIIKEAIFAVRTTPRWYKLWAEVCLSAVINFNRAINEDIY